MLQSDCFFQVFPLLECSDDLIASFLHPIPQEDPGDHSFTPINGWRTGNETVARCRTRDKKGRRRDRDEGDEKGMFIYLFTFLIPLFLVSSDFDFRFNFFFLLDRILVTVWI